MAWFTFACDPMSPARRAVESARFMRIRYSSSSLVLFALATRRFTSSAVGDWAYVNVAWSANKRNASDFSSVFMWLHVFCLKILIISVRYFKRGGGSGVVIRFVNRFKLLL